MALAIARLSLCLIQLSSGPAHSQASVSHLRTVRVSSFIRLIWDEVVPPNHPRPAAVTDLCGRGIFSIGSIRKPLYSIMLSGPTLFHLPALLLAS